MIYYNQVQIFKIMKSKAFLILQIISNKDSINNNNNQIKETNL